MAENKFVVCFNAMEKRFFEVNALHLVQDPYRANFYRLSLRLNFYNGDVDVDQTDNMRQLCLRKITNLMTAQNMWQNHHSFYEIKYEIRLVVRNNGDLIQHNIEQNEDEKNNESSDTESVSTVSSEQDSNSSEDSAYSSLGPFAGEDSSNESTHHWEDDTFEDFSGSEDMTSSDDD